MKKASSVNSKKNPLPNHRKSDLTVVGIGASAGGLESFISLVEAISEKSGASYILIQHLDPTHDSRLSEILQKSTKIPVIEISEGMLIEPDHIYVMPSNRLLAVAEDLKTLRLLPLPTGKRSMPIDSFFNSLADLFQLQSIGVLLSGNGHDGTEGLKNIQSNGGITIAQALESAAHPDMPASAIQAGVVDFVLSPESIPPRLLELTNTSVSLPDESQAEIIQEVFTQINLLLRIRKGKDFTHYKQTTIRRRILRRMVINKKESPAEYYDYLRSNKEELDLLFQDLLIQVTSFFRNPENFTYLSDSILPEIFKNSTDNSSIRIWVAGCSSGEEAYSMAILFSEYLGKHRQDYPHQKIQVLATDLSKTAIQKARKGLYSKTSISAISATRLELYFTKTPDGYQINQSIRDICLFANHDFVKDPPFGKIDLISCRNVLIYMEPYLQKKALTTFHYAIKPTGYLMLGESETTTGVPDLFSSLSKRKKIYSRKEVISRFLYSVNNHEKLINQSPPPLVPQDMSMDFQKKADEILLKQYSPPGVVVNDSHDIVQFRGITRDYLEQSPGKPTHNLISLAKQGLAFELRNLLHKAKKEGKEVHKENITVRVNDILQSISIQVTPIPSTLEAYYLVLFKDRLVKTDQAQQQSASQAQRTIGEDEKETRIRQLELELTRTRDDMRSITEDQEAAYEELQSVNEELLSGSEELQSMNEELETSKEELQSSNEELIVLNHEMNALTEQLETAKNYAESIVDNIREPLVVLDEDFKVKSANNAFYYTFRLKERETIGSLFFQLNNHLWDIKEVRTLLEELLTQKSFINDFEVTASFEHLGEAMLSFNARKVLNKVTSEHIILLSIEDITLKKKRHLQEEEMAKRFRELMLQAPVAMMVLVGPDYVVELANQAYLAIVDKDESFVGQLLFDSLPELRNQGIKELLDGVRQSGQPFSSQELEIHLLKNKELTQGFFNVVYHPIYSTPNQFPEIIVTVGDVTEQVLSRKIITTQQEQVREKLEGEIEKRTIELKQANDSLVEKNMALLKMNQELEAFTYVSSHDLKAPLRKIQTLAGRILEKENDNLSPRGKTHLQLMNEAANRMQNLVQDLLDFARLSGTGHPLETTDLQEIVDEILDAYKDSIKEKEAKIESQDLGSLPVIRFQFRQLFENLISNALKFSNPAISPHIVIRMEKTTGAKAKNKALLPKKSYSHLSISDNGMGFKPEYNEKIFQVFQKLPHPGEIASTGIGLAIVKKVVEIHNGVISASGIENEGATFDIFIPLAE